MALVNTTAALEYQAEGSDVPPVQERGLVENGMHVQVKKLSGAARRKLKRARQGMELEAGLTSCPPLKSFGSDKVERNIPRETPTIKQKISEKGFTSSPFGTISGHREVQRAAPRWASSNLREADAGPIKPPYPIPSGGYLEVLRNNSSEEFADYLMETTNDFTYPAYAATSGRYQLLQRTIPGGACAMNRLDAQKGSTYSAYPMYSGGYKEINPLRGEPSRNINAEWDLTEMQRAITRYCPTSHKDPSLMRGAQKMNLSYHGASYPKRPWTQERRDVEEAASNEITTVHKVAVVQEGFPDIRITEEQKDLIVKNILDAIDLLEPGEGHQTPAFDGYFLRGGAFRIKCRDQDTKDWLKGLISECKPWEGANLRVVQVKNLLKKPVRCKVWIPGATEESSKILRRLEVQNAGLSTSGWRVVYSRAAPKGQVLVILMDLPSWHLLSTLEYRPHLNFYRVEFIRLGNRKVNEHFRDGGEYSQRH